MTEVLVSALKDTIAIVPWLFVIYMALEIVERRFEHFVRNSIAKTSAAGPLLGALFGCIPQCGFSVIAAALYAQRVITTGTLLAVFISTSDEAIPVILAQPERAGVIIPILATKIVLAIIAGYGIDFIFGRFSKPRQELALHNVETCDTPHHHCCSHSHVCQESWWKSVFVFPIKQTLKICFFVFLILLGINFIIAKVGAENLSSIFLANTFFQPVIAVGVGLIPSCAASVIIAEVFLKGGISFGSAIAGLSAGAGLGTLVLIRENKNVGESMGIIGLLIIISFAAGFILNQFPLFH